MIQFGSFWFLRGRFVLDNCWISWGGAKDLVFWEPWGLDIVEVAVLLRFDQLCWVHWNHVRAVVLHVYSLTIINRQKRLPLRMGFRLNSKNCLTWQTRILKTVSFYLNKLKLLLTILWYFFLHPTWLSLTFFGINCEGVLQETGFRFFLFLTSVMVKTLGKLF